jgi:hypothetical protein
MGRRVEAARARPRFDTFVFWGDGPGQLARFAEEVVPAVRAAITTARR